MMSDNDSGNAPVEEQIGEQTGQKQVRLRIDEQNMQTSYANMFRTNGTPEEILLDFGLNLTEPTPGQAEQPQIVFKVSQRVIMNYHFAKRLTLALGQVVRRHEEQFGELELDVNKRRKADG